MSTGLAHKSLDSGGMCYAACQEAFEWWNSSMFWCQKGCDIGRGRMSDPLLRQQTEHMCKMLATSNYALMEDENLDKLDDLRIHATMYSNNASNLYRACLAGVRRQKY
jgi:hypothetical protein